MPERIPIVNVIIEKDKQILMLKRNFLPKDKLDILGGYVDKNESIEEAAIREAKEESGFDVELVSKFGQYDYFDRGEKTTHVYIGKIIGGKIKESKEGVPLWMDSDKIRKEELAFPQVHARVLEDFFGSGQLKNPKKRERKGGL